MMSERSCVKADAFKVTAASELASDGGMKPPGYTGAVAGGF